MLASLMVTIFVGAAAVRVFDDGSDVENSQGCVCFDKGICSSCDMQECPFVGGISYVRGLGTGGTDILNGFAAWTVKTVSGKHYIVKFGGLEAHKKEALQAAQIAHALHVMTPRQLLIDYTSCASLWEEGFGDASFQDHEGGNAAPTKAAFINSLDDMRKCPRGDSACEGMPKVVVQEHASYLTLPSQFTNVERSFWYQAGAISAFDWITGKSDLFNDLSLGWKDDLQEEDSAKEVNRHNIGFDRSKLVAIDLGVNMPLVKWELWDQLLEQIPSSSSADDLTWVKKVLWPMLAMMKAGGGHDSIENFGRFKLEDLSGWDRQLSPWLTMLGLTKTIHKALQMFSAAETATAHQQFLSSLTGMKHADAKGGTLRESLSRKVQQLQNFVTREVKERKAASYVCCKVKCDRRYGYFGSMRTACKVKSEHALMKLGSALAVVGGFIKTVPETDCEDITSYRLSEKSQDSNQNEEAAKLREEYCDCGDEKKQRIALTTANRNACDSA